MRRKIGTIITCVGIFLFMFPLISWLQSTSISYAQTIINDSGWYLSGFIIFAIGMILERGVE